MIVVYIHNLDYQRFILYPQFQNRLVMLNRYPVTMMYTAFPHYALRLNNNSGRFDSIEELDNFIMSYEIEHQNENTLRDAIINIDLTTPQRVIRDPYDLIKVVVIKKKTPTQIIEEVKLYE